MHVGIRLLSYFGILGALFGGAAGTLYLMAPERGAASTASAAVQQRPVPPKIAAWQERNAIPMPPMESRNPEPTGVVPAIAALVPQPVGPTHYPAVKEAKVTNRVAPLKPKPKQTAVKRAPQLESALGYAAVPPSPSYEHLIFAFRDRPSH